MSDGGKVLVVGYGVVGKRIADAVHLQDDMQLCGVVDVSPTSLVAVANQRLYPLFAASTSARETMINSGLHVDGVLSDALGCADIVVDASPGGAAATNVPLYEQSGKPYILNGGEKHSLVDLSFNSFANYRSALLAKRARVVSCNTTSICRIVATLQTITTLEDIVVAIVRRGADPVHKSSSPINSIEPTLGESHHARDVMTVIPRINISSLAVKASTTLSHVHMMRVKCGTPVDKEHLLNAFSSTPRIILVNGSHGVTSNAHVLELFRDKLRPRGDMWEVAIWEDSLVVEGNTVVMSYCVHMESIVVPENVDAIRALLNLQATPSGSITKTDKSLGCFQDQARYEMFDRTDRTVGAEVIQ